MRNVQQLNFRTPGKMAAILTIMVSGLCWYFGNGLNGDYWFLVWLAPVPVLIFSKNAPMKPALLVSFIAYLVGRLSWFSYLVKVATLAPAIIFTLALPLVFTLIIFLTRRSFLKTKSWYSVFAFPVFFTAFEYILFTFSPDGTAGSIAYSQSNFLPLIQIASITGVLGVTFFATLIPSLIASGWYFRNNRAITWSLIITGVIIISSVFLFGLTRMRHLTSDSISAGLVVLDEKRHDVSDHPDFHKEIQLVQDYSNEIEHLSAQGAKIVVLPERAFNINNEIKDTVIGMLRELAVRNKVAIVTGYTNFTGTHERNSALVISAEGEIANDYNKCHLVTGLEDQFTRGDQAGLFKNGNTSNGVAICKDLDYPGYIRTYGKEKINLLYIPAWDFVTDDWLHSRMAVLRGVENGFSEIRAARQGRLTISDYYGRVNYEANASSGAKTILLGKVDAVRLPTLYNKWGNWFGILNLAAAVCFIFLGFKRNPARQ